MSFGWGAVKTRLAEWDGWIRRRVRMVQMRSWRNPRNIHRILKRKGWKLEKLLFLRMYRWRNSKCQMVHAALDNAWFDSFGWKSLTKLYQSLVSPT